MSNEPKKFTGADLGSVFAKNDALNTRKTAITKERGINSRELEVALAVILVDLAGADGSFEQAEYSVIVSGLSRVFGTAKDEVTPLVNQAKNILQGLRGTSSQAALLKQYLTQEEKISVMDVIDDLIASDGVEDGFETYLRAKTADLLGLPRDFDAKY
jgi:uncharacterized tellurite resistance protein B-like protein